MAKYSNTIEYNISTKLDSSGLTKLKTELQQVELKLQKLGNQKLLNPEDFSDARTQIRGLSDALSKAFNPTLGITDLSKLNKELQESGVTTEGLRSAFSQLGTDGQIAFNNVIGELGKLDTGILRTNSQIDKLFTTFSNTFRWGLVSSFFSNFMNSIHQSVDYVKELDDSLTQIMLVTDYNRDAMNQYAKSANEAAKAVSMTTTGMTNASLIFAQQGYNLNQSQELATLSAKLANASQQDTATTSDQITAYMNAYGLQNSMEELTQQMDNWALIANVSAADVGELAQASQRAASMANAVGVSGEQLAAQIATIESVTREAPEQIGNGLKTLYARFSDIEAGGEDEEGFTLGKITSQLDAIGVQILDQFGNIRDVGDIMEDLMVIWDDLDQTSKVAASQALAGKYQVNRFMALMDNSGMYQEYKGATGNTATGTLDQMNEEFANSIEGRTAKLQASLEGLFSTIFDTDDIYPWMDAAQGAIDLLQQFFDALGGGKTVLLGLSALLTQIFSKNIAQEINNAMINNAVQEQRKANLENKQAALSNMGMANPELDNGMSNYIIDFAKQINGLNLNKEQMEQANSILMELIQNANAAGQASDELATKISGIGAALVSTLGEDSKVLTPILEDGIINDTLLRDFLDNASDDQLKELFEGSRQAIVQAKIELKEFSQALQTFQQETKENDQSADELKNSIERLRDAFSYIKNTIDTSTYNQYDEELQNIIETLKNSDDASDDVSVLTNRIAKLYEELDKIKGINVEKIQQISSDLERSNFKQINTQGAFEGTKQVGNAFLKSANKTLDIKNIIDTINAVQQLTFAWQAFQNLGSLWINEDLSIGEKVLQTVINLTMAMLQLVPIIDKVSGNLFGNVTSNLTKKINELKSNIDKTGQANLLIQERLNDIEKKRATVNKKIETTIKNHGKDAKSLASDYSRLNNLEQSRALLQKELAAGTLTQGEYEKQIEAIDKRIVALKRAQMAATIGISVALMAVSAAIGAIQEQERQRIQKITDDAEDSRSKLDSIKESSFFEEWDSFKENGKLTDELKESMAALAQQMGINIEAQDIYSGNIEQLNDKIRDNIELEKERARTNFQIENNEFENQLNKKSIQAAQVGGTVTTAAGTFNSAVDYVSQAGAAKSLAERLGEVADAQTEVNDARKQFGTNSIEYTNALNNYQKLKDQLNVEGVDADKAADNLKRLANLAIEDFKAGKDIESITGADWINFIADENTGQELQEYLTSLGKESALQFKLGLLSQSDSENPIYSMIKGPGQFDLSNANLSTTEDTVLDFTNLIQSGIDPSELGSDTWEEFAQAFSEAQNIDPVIISPKLNFESKYDFDNDQEVLDYLENYTDMTTTELDTATSLRLEDHEDEGNRFGGNLENNTQIAEQHVEEAQAAVETSTNIRDLKKAHEELAEAQEELQDVEKKTIDDQKLYEKAVQRAAAASARMSKTLDQMSKHFDENKEILDEGNKSTAEYAQALAETKDDLAGLLDVDPSMLSNSFAASEEALSAMNTMLHGTNEEAEAAYESLRELAAQDIIDHLEVPAKIVGVDGTEFTAESIRSTLSDMISSLNAQDLSIDMEADIDTQEWYNKVNELLASGAITADQLTQVLSAAGYEGELDTERGTGKMQQMTYKIETTGFQVPANATPNDLLNLSGTITMTPQLAESVDVPMDVPVLKGATQKGGFVNNAGGSGGRRSSSGGGGGGKGGGGGGSKAKTIQPKEKKDHKKDYYEEVNGQLNKTEKILSKIEKEEDRLIGDKARANQNKQLKLLQKEIDFNNKKLTIQKQELSDVDELIKDQDELAEKTAKNAGITDFSVPDVILDADGIISNYEEISKRIDDIHNSLIDKYNEAAKAGNEELTKQLEKTISQFDKYGESILNGAQRHNALKAEIEGTVGELENLKDAIEDIRIDAWKDSTEAIDNLKELRENAAELEGFFSEYESDSPFRALIVDSEKLNNIWSIGKEEAKEYYNEIIAGKEEALKKTKDKDERAAIQTSIDYFKNLRDNLSDTGLNNGLLGYAFQDLQQLQKWYENPKAKDNPFGDNTAALRDAYNESFERFQQLSEEAEKAAEDYRDDIIDAYDYIENQQDRQIDKFDRVIDRLEHFSDMYALYYGDESYDMMRDVLQQQGNVLREQLNQQKTIYTYWVNQYAQVLETGDEKLIQEIEDKMNNAADKITELAEDAAKTFADSYENAVKASTQHIIQNTIGDKNFDRLDRNWEWDKDYLEKYKDNVEKAYEMDKLRNKYTDLLNQAQGASLQTQNKIRAQMQEQLALLKGQENVSEYDVKLANAKLEILQKQIALEDAQRNKNQMKLRRDTQGNYRYVYTANQNDVSGAQQDLLDSEYDAYELSKNQQMNNYDELINAYKRYLSQREEILNNANLSEQEKLDQNAKLYDKFLKFVDRAKEDFSDAAYGTLDILNWLTLNGTDYTTTAAVGMLNKLLDEQGNIKDKTGVIWMDNATYLTDEVIPKISGAVEAADNDIKNRLNELEQNMVGKDGVIPKIVNGIEGEDGLTTALNEARTSTDGLAVSTENLMEKLAGNNESLAKAQAELQEYIAELNNAKNASSIAADTIKKMQKQLDQSEAEKLNYLTDLDKLKSGKYEFDNKGNVVEKQKNQSKNISNAKSQGNWNAKDDAYQIWMNGKWGGGGYWYGPYKADGHTEAQADAVLALFNSGYGYEWMDTGGYTGTWKGNEGMSNAKNGKLAVLHQKELVLNSEDTKNILAAVDIVRQIGTGLRNSVSNMNLPFGKALNTIGNTIEQRVEITASFPNATDADDIRQALIGLSDKAYQYAHRTI